MGKVSITYQEYGKLIDDLTVKIEEETKDIKFDGIYGIPRGGLPVAVHLSNHLDIPLFTSIKRFIQKYPNGKLLITKDVMNKGLSFEHTLEIIEQQNVDFHIAGIFYRTGSNFEPDIYIKKTKSWIIFPWEPIEVQLNTIEEYEEYEVQKDDVASMVNEDLQDFVNVM